MKVFDIHAHIYPDAIADRAVHAISHAYDDFPVENDGRLETLIREMDDAGVTACAAHSVATTAHQPGKTEHNIGWHIGTHAQ